jgi:hypothetical protein
MMVPADGHKVHHLLLEGWLKASCLPSCNALKQKEYFFHSQYWDVDHLQESSWKGYSAATDV